MFGLYFCPGVAVIIIWTSLPYTMGQLSRTIICLFFCSYCTCFVYLFGSFILVLSIFDFGVCVLFCVTVAATMHHDMRKTWYLVKFTTSSGNNNHGRPEYWLFLSWFGTTTFTTPSTKFKCMHMHRSDDQYKTMFSCEYVDTN